MISGLLDKVGFADCAPPPGQAILRITLVSATNVKIRAGAGFYFEAWAEPMEGYPKISRVHRPSKNLDLGCEPLELEWSGTEAEVVIHAVEYSGTTQHRDTPFGEVRIPRDAVYTYARESQTDRSDLRLGTRVFDLSPIEKQEAFRRRQRFQDQVVPIQWVDKFITGGGAAQGLHVPSPLEAQKLREENRRLKGENGRLRYLTGNSWTEDLDHPLKPLSIAARFEIIMKKKGSMRSSPRSMIRQASFQRLGLE